MTAASGMSSRLRECTSRRALMLAKNARLSSTELSQRITGSRITN